MGHTCEWSQSSSNIMAEYAGQPLRLLRPGHLEGNHEPDAQLRPARGPHRLVVRPQGTHRHLQPRSLQSQLPPTPITPAWRATPPRPVFPSPAPSRWASSRRRMWDLPTICSAAARQLCAAASAPTTTSIPASTHTPPSRLRRTSMSSLSTRVHLRSAGPRTTRSPASPASLRLTRHSAYRVGLGIPQRPPLAGHLFLELRLVAHFPRGQQN